MTADPAQRSRPDDSEQIPYYRQYIDLVPEGDIIEILANQIGPTQAYLGEFSRHDALWRPAPEEWNVLEIVGHLADIERLMTYRSMRIARGDATPWGNVEVDEYVEHGGFDQRETADIVGEYAAVRAATVAFLRGLAPAAWGRRNPADGFSVRSVRSFAYIMAGHELHHLESMRSQRA